MSIFKTKSPKETEEVGKKLGSALKSGDVVAMFGGMGMGKTAFTHGIAEGMGIDPHQVSSPTFALVQEYGENRKLYHFDMYRIDSWDDLYSTGFFDYLEQGGILAVEWSENIENALPDGYIRVEFSRGEGENERIINISGGKSLENTWG